MLLARPPINHPMAQPQHHFGNPKESNNNLPLVQSTAGGNSPASCPDIDTSAHTAATMELSDESRPSVPVALEGEGAQTAAEDDQPLLKSSSTHEQERHHHHHRHQSRHKDHRHRHHHEHSRHHRHNGSSHGRKKSHSPSSASGHRRHRSQAHHEEGTNSRRHHRSRKHEGKSHKNRSTSRSLSPKRSVKSKSLASHFAASSDAHSHATNSIDGSHSSHNPTSVATEPPTLFSTHSPKSVSSLLTPLEASQRSFHARRLTDRLKEAYHQGKWSGSSHAHRTVAAPPIPTVLYSNHANDMAIPVLHSSLSALDTTVASNNNKRPTATDQSARDKLKSCRRGCHGGHAHQQQHADDGEDKQNKRDLLTKTASLPTGLAATKADEDDLLLLNRCTKSDHDRSRPKREKEPRPSWAPEPLLSDIEISDSDDDDDDDSNECSFAFCFPPTPLVPEPLIDDSDFTHSSTESFFGEQKNLLPRKKSTCHRRSRSDPIEQDDDGDDYGDDRAKDDVRGRDSLRRSLSMPISRQTEEDEHNHRHRHHGRHKKHRKDKRKRKHKHKHHHEGHRTRSPAVVVEPHVQKVIDEVGDPNDADFWDKMVAHWENLG